MLIKNRIIRWIVYIILGLGALYTGISCAATFYRAFTQPYLTMGTTVFNFLGYYIIAALNGIVCIIAATILIVMIIREKRAKKT